MLPLTSGGQFFCGRDDSWRDNGVARVFDSITSQQECEQSYVCDTLDDQAAQLAGAPLVVAGDPAQCDSIGACSVPCFDDVCLEMTRRASVCYTTDLAACASLSGSVERGFCVLPAGDAVACASYGANNTVGLPIVSALWEDDQCTTLLGGNLAAACGACEAGVGCPATNVFLRCVVSRQPRPCADAAECAASAACSDRDELTFITSRILYPLLDYICVFPLRFGWEQVRALWLVSLLRWNVAVS